MKLDKLSTNIEYTPDNITNAPEHIKERWINKAKCISSAYERRSITLGETSPETAFYDENRRFVIKSTNRKTLPFDKRDGVKYDKDKIPVLDGLISYFPRACLEVANVSKKGAEKYTWKGWETVPDGIKRYSNALLRHILSKEIDGEIDPETGLLHDSHIAWNALAVLQLTLMEKSHNEPDINLPS